MEKNNDNISKKLTFSDSIDFRNVNFSYLGKEGKGIKNINIKVNRGEFIGIVGTSGAGKTTFADVLSGLLPIDSGEIMIDGKA
ncbi:ATP-binding cassette domain-containing protein, partial [Vibrio cholerae]|uniref:ATP-binding cassette domain-containing protein n=1 Tax=Vibrio cholerae TaxID=666 RepID=UPI001F462E1A